MIELACMRRLEGKFPSAGIAERMGEVQKKIIPSLNAMDSAFLYRMSPYVVARWTALESLQES